MNAGFEHIDLFSGIGGFALGARMSGIETIAFCEKDKFCRQVLRKNFPGRPICKDIKEFGYEWLIANTDSIGELQSERIVSKERERSGDSNQKYILTGGFPCQPFSIAGARKGTTDDRFLWSEMLRVIHEISPAWIIAENVFGILTSEQGVVFESICFDLESAGYNVQPFVIPACAVGAPHRRDRIWIVASNSDCIGDRGRSDENFEGQERTLQTERSDCNAADPDSINGDISGFDSAEISEPEKTEVFWDKDWYEAASELCRVDDGFSEGLDKGRRLKSLGNAIVPQIAKIIFEAIIHEHHNPHIIQ